MPSIRRGDVVRVKSREEILSTLDGNGTVAALPFMPEMLKFAGQELTVSASAHKTCDTVEHLGHLRELDKTVHLEGARCDGSAHGGCQAACLLFWREEWLEGQPAAQNDPPLATAETLTEQTQHGELYSCQATAMREASRPLPSLRPGQYVADFRSRNAGLPLLLKSMLIAAFNLFQWQTKRRLPRRLRLFGGRTFPFYGGTGTGKRIPAAGEIQPGDLVRVRSKPEIMATLNADNKNAGMIFDGEMLPFCGIQARVERKVETIIDEPTGKMLKLNDCLVLEDVVCLGTYHRLCPRGGLPYWREAWLEKVDEPA
jgi:hypothetical protein